MENNKNKSYFISDVHLGYFDREIGKVKEEMFIKYLDFISKDAKSIYLLGDIFDYWFEWKKVIPKIYFRVLSKLYDLKHAGIEIIYLMGNHDFGHNSFFEEELGIPIFSNEFTTEIDNKKFFLHHGDGLVSGDNGYKLLKKITRNKTNQKLYTSLLHPNFAIKLASQSSKKSRNYKSYDHSVINNKILEFAKSKINLGFDYVILGHLHNKEITKINNGYYINLGDWLSSPNIGLFNGKEFLFIDSDFIK